MKKQEQNLADELEKVIKDAQLQQTGKAHQLPPGEEQLAQKLAALSEESNPSPAFVGQLRGRLIKRAAELQTNKKSSEIATFWQNIRQMFLGDSIMKRTFVVGAVLALIVVAGFFILGRGLNESDPSQIAGVAATTEATLPVTVLESETAISPTETVDSTDPAPSETEEIEAPDVTPSAPEDLPQLPRIGGQALGGGLGGGGTEGGSEGADLTRLAGDPFLDTNFIVNSAFPLEPVSGLVQQRLQGDSVDAALARQVADQYGFSGPIYREIFPSSVPTEGPGAPPVTYVAFDGPRTLRIDPWAISFIDDAAAATIDFGNQKPLSDAAELAESFLLERGQLDFPYQAQVQAWGDVFFYRLVDGVAVLEPEITLSLNPEGQVASVYDSVSTGWDMAGSYPLISAEEAWQHVLDGVIQNGILYQTIANEQDQPAPAPEPGAEEAYQYWSRELLPGTEVHLYDWPQVYQPIDGGSPVIKMRNITIMADDDTLNALADSRDNHLHLWGDLSDDSRQLQLIGWEALSEYNPISQQGVIMRQGNQVIFQGSEGDTFILPNAPEDLTDGLEVNVFANGIRDTGLEYPLLDWENLDKIIEFTEEPIIEGPPSESFEAFRYDQIQIDTIELAYLVTYLFPEGSVVGGDALVESVEPTIFLQPAWSYKGTADNGDTIQFFVQAVASDYLQP